MKNFRSLFLSLRVFAAGALFAGIAARADVTLPSVFGSHMVLQREQPIPVWGRAAPGEKITVTLAQDTVHTTANPAGDWRVDLPARPAGGPFTLGVEGKDTRRFDDVLIGDVWLCSGQSNMGLRVDQAKDAAAEIAAANFPEIRLLTVRRAVAETEQFDFKGTWTVCAPSTVGAFSAAGYFMGRELHRELGVPIGLIHSSWGGTTAEAWTPRPVLAANPDLQPILERWQQELADFPRKQTEFKTNYETLMTEWRAAAAKAKREGRMPPSEPRLRTGPGTQYQPSGLYYGMISPLVPFGLRGIAWYQGEANVARAHQYRQLFPAMITAWREAWGRPDLPFVFVQLPNLARQPEPSRSGWAELRESQAMTLALPHTGMAVTIDVGDPQDLHPVNKQPVGHRLALVAGHVANGLPAGPRLSPVFRAAQVDAGRLRVTFAPGAEGLRASDGGALRGFVIAGEDKQFVEARAEIDGDTVVVWSDAVARPVAVRYAWADNPACNLASAAGLPTSPFRSDDWPEVTTGKK